MVAPPRRKGEVTASRFQRNQHFPFASSNQLEALSQIASTGQEQTRGPRAESSPVESDASRVLKAPPSRVERR